MKMKDFYYKLLRLQILLGMDRNGDVLGGLEEKYLQLYVNTSRYLY